MISPIWRPTPTGQGKTWEEPDALADLITSTLAPESWDAAGGRGTIQLVPPARPGCLSCPKIIAVQRQVERLLSELHAAVKRHAPAKATRGEGPATRGEGPRRTEDQGSRGRSRHRWMRAIEMMPVKHARSRSDGFQPPGAGQNDQPPAFKNLILSPIRYDSGSRGKFRG